MSPWSILFWTPLVAGAFIYAGYPAILLLRATLRPRPIRPGQVTPRVSIIVAAHNEAAVIEAKIRNTEALAYAPGLLELIVVSDGSTDGTVTVARQAAGPGVRVLDAPRLGKAHALNLGAATAVGEVLVFTDANTMLRGDALRRLVASFADPEVGGVCGNKRYLPACGGDATGEGEGRYWQFDSWLKGLESSAGSVFAADGALYAIRRPLYVPITDPAQADDIAISARVVLRGHRLVFERDALVYEPAPADARTEFRRKVRVTNHSLRALLNLGSGLWSSGFYSVQLLCHKFFRHFTPVLWLLLLVATAGLALDAPVFRLALAAQMGLLVLAVAGYRLRHHRLGRSGWLALPTYFCGVNLAALLGIISLLRGRRLQLWTPRGGPAAALEHLQP